MPNQLDAALMNSEDSEIINTSFVERLNLTIREAVLICSARRRVIAGARSVSPTNSNCCVAITTSFARIAL